MPLIEGIGDEVTHFFIGLIVILVVSLAWWTTSISEQRQIQTVWLLDRRRHRAHRRLTNHTHAVTIAEGSTVAEVAAEAVPPEPGAAGVKNPEPSQPPEASTSGADDRARIVEAMDADCVRQRRLAFYDKPPEEEPDEGTDIRIKLKYINDDLKLVNGKLQEQLGDFKKRHFQVELSSNKLVRLIFNGQVLQQDNKTLEGCGLFDNCVVHCLIHQRRSTGGDEMSSEAPRGEQPAPRNNQNNQGRDWDLGNFLFAIISFTLLSAWYFRYVYAHLYTVTATVGLVLMTGIFTIVLFSFYFPDQEQIPQTPAQS